MKKLILLIALCGFATGCAKVSKLHPFAVPDGSQLIVQYIGNLTRAEITNQPAVHQIILKSGIPDTAIHDASISIGRTKCCGWSQERNFDVWFYTDPGIQISNGDFVLVQMGRHPTKTDPGAINRFLLVRQKAGPNGEIKWTPDNPHLWMRILYADWMKEQGWVEQKNMTNPTWYKPPEPTSKP